MNNYNEILESARKVIRIEAEAVEILAKRLDENFAKAVLMILECPGRVVVTGNGQVRPDLPENGSDHGFNRDSCHIPASG